MQCEYAATTLGHLKIHVKSKHEGVRYPCSQCEHAATTASNLKTHVESKHEEVQYPCPECEFFYNKSKLPEETCKK